MNEARWEYRIEEIKRGFWPSFDAAAVKAQLNQFGAEGWELVQVQFNRWDYPVRCFLKRRCVR